MPATSMTVGAVTDTAARVTVTVTETESGRTIRITYDTSPDFDDDPQFTTGETNVFGGSAGLTFDLEPLTADTRYYARVQDELVTDESITTQWVTDPVSAGSPASFTIGCVGDAGLRPVEPGTSGDAPERLSNHPIFDAIRQRALDEGWRRLCHLGDICYYDLGSGNHGLSSSATADQYRTMWDDILAQPRQHELYRSVPWVYMWDDHDYGPNNASSIDPGRDNACTVYRERVPHYDLPLSGTTDSPGHYFHIGRVLCVISDTRADRSPNSDPDDSSKTMLGTDQKTWLDTLLSSDSSEALIWLMPSQWIGTSTDSWGNFSAERAELVSMLDGHGWTGRTVMVNADKHAAALDSGAGGNADFGGWPVALCAPLDADTGGEHTQYDQGMWMRRSGQYATVHVADDGDDVHITTTVWRGERALGWTTLHTGTTTRIEAGSPASVIAL